MIHDEFQGQILYIFHLKLYKCTSKYHTFDVNLKQILLHSQENEINISQEGMVCFK